MKGFFLVLFVLVTVHGYNHHFKHNHKQHSVDDKRIAGGQSTRIEEYPYQVALVVLQYIPFSNIVVQAFCGGSIISDQHILTAAHCFSSIPNNLIWVKLGTSTISNVTATVIGIEKVIPHPNYKKEVYNTEDGPTVVMYNDIAILKLNKKITFNENVAKIDLPESNSEPSITTAVATGWGYLSSSKNKTVPDRLMKVTLPVLSHKECSKRYSYSNQKIEDTHICTLYPGQPQSPCPGDSGGPLAQDGKVIGVVSLGPEICDGGETPSIYTKVSKFVDWINDQLKI